MEELDNLVIVFSYKSKIIKNIIYANKNRTKRVYISATINEVFDEIFLNNDRYKINDTLIDQIYLISNSYEHII